MPWRRNANDHDIDDVQKQNCKPFQGAPLSSIAQDVDAPAQRLNRRLADELLIASMLIYSLFNRHVTLLCEKAARKAQASAASSALRAQNLDGGHIAKG